MDLYWEYSQGRYWMKLNGVIVAAIFELERDAVYQVRNSLRNVKIPKDMPVADAKALVESLVCLEG